MARRKKKDDSFIVSIAVVLGGAIGILEWLWEQDRALAILAIIAIILFSVELLAKTASRLLKWMVKGTGRPRTAAPKAQTRPVRQKSTARVLLEALVDSEDDDPGLARKMDLFGLEKTERDLVRSGRYNPWDFEYDEEATEEDDYYYDAD